MDEKDTELQWKIEENENFKKGFENCSRMRRENERSNGRSLYTKGRED